jgi:hypothetical protein
MSLAIVALGLIAIPAYVALLDPKEDSIFEDEDNDVELVNLG